MGLEIFFRGLPVGGLNPGNQPIGQVFSLSPTLPLARSPSRCHHLPGGGFQFGEAFRLFLAQPFQFLRRLSRHLFQHSLRVGFAVQQQRQELARDAGQTLG